MLRNLYPKNSKRGFGGCMTFSLNSLRDFLSFDIFSTRYLSTPIHHAKSLWKSILSHNTNICKTFLYFVIRYNDMFPHWNTNDQICVWQKRLNSDFFAQLVVSFTFFSFLKFPLLIPHLFNPLKCTSSMMEKLGTGRFFISYVPKYQ